MSDPAHLRDRFDRPGAVRVEISPLGGTVVRLTFGDAMALVALRGGQVLQWLESGQGLLWLSPVARLKTAKSIRGGIPVCWPWFGDHLDDPGKPAHGFVRHRDWALEATEAGPDGVCVTLATATTARDQELWPHVASARVTVTLGAGLTVALQTVNQGRAPFPLTQALHTYFRVADIARVSVWGLEGLDYLDKLDAFARKRQAGPIGFGAEVDRIYLGAPQGLVLHDSGNERRIAIAAHGSLSTVVWNPWSEKTIRLGDMGSPEAFRQMVCIETANAGDDIVTLAPGASHVLRAAYRVAR